ncbi:MAG: hypothetical protein ACREMF_07635 [Gemmatimonadales bacterium]
MPNGKLILAGVTLVVSLGLAPPTAPFAVASIRLEQNATDGDFEVVVEAKGGEDGLTRLTVVAPDGRTVVDLTAPDASTLGVRQFRFESPEPSNAAKLKAAYPAGVYTFSGSTAGGVKLSGTATLSHALPAPASVIRPAADARDVAIRDVGISWTPVTNLAAYIVYVENHELDVEITARLPATAASFAVPNGFLVPGKEYTLGIGTVTRDGNMSFVETAFTTAWKE